LFSHVPFSIDATNVLEGYGRMVNDSPPDKSNSAMKRVVHNNEVYLCLHATKYVKKGTELR